MAIWDPTPTQALGSQDCRIVSALRTTVDRLAWRTFWRECPVQSARKNRLTLAARCKLVILRRLGQFFEASLDLAGAHADSSGLPGRFFGPVG